MGGRCMEKFVGLLIPFAGTTLGAGMVFFMRGKIHPKLGFAAGVMIAASVWSLLIPGIEMAQEQGKIAWIPAAVGFLLGILFLLLLDTFIPHLHLKGNSPEGVSAKLPRATMLLLAVTLHNIPEGMAVGVAYAGAEVAQTGITWASALVLSLGIAIQNFPEGAIISMPLRSEGFKKWKAFIFGSLSGIVEPIAAFITLMLAEMVVPFLPYFLSFAAGAMIYVVVEELIPESQAGDHSNIGTIGAALGFVVMMVLDVALG